MNCIVLCLAALLMCASAALAAPSQMNYQGQLFLNGSPTAGPVSIIFRMFDAQTGGTELWTETDIVTVTGGLFSTTLGNGTAFPTTLFSAQVPWLEMEVSGTILTPRTQFTSVPYALNAPAIGGNELWSTDGTNVWRVGGKVGIGNASPGELLHLEKGSGPGASMLVRSYVAGTGSLGKLQFQNVLATEGGIAAEIEAVRPVATWGQESDLLFKTNPGSASPALAERMRITKDGKVGIGLPNPQTTLDMVGGLKMRLQPAGENSGMSFNAAPESPSIGFHASDNSQRFTLATNILANNADDLLRFNGSVAGNILALKGNGNVGIGTPGPMDKLEVAGNLTIGAYDGTLNDVVLRAAGGCPNCGNNSEGGSHLVLRSGIGTGSAASGDIVFQVSDNVNYGNQQPHAILEAMRIQTTTGTVSIPGNLSVGGTKCRVVQGTKYGDLYYNATESAHALFSLEGEAKLRNGRCAIALDPKWLAGVTIDEMYPMSVTITAFYGPHGGQGYVERTKTGFTLIDPSGSNAAFGWKVEARQKGYEDVYLNRPEPTAAKVGDKP